MDDNRVTNIVAQLAPIISGRINFDGNPFDTTVRCNDTIVKVSIVKIRKCDSTCIPGFSQQIAETEEIMNKQLSYSKLIGATHDGTTNHNWIDKNNRTSCINENSIEPFNSVVTKIYEHILKVPIFEFVHGGNEFVQKYRPDIDVIHQNLLKPLCLIESADAFYSVVVISPDAETFSLLDVARFSSDFLKNNPDKLLFVLYQLASTLNYCGIYGFLPMDVRLRAVSVDPNCWIRLDLGYCLAQLAENIDEFGASSGYDAGHHRNQDKSSHRPLWEWTRMWVSNQISNFQYLTILNDFAGRRKSDPYYHPVFPWVVDFSCPDAGFRDLSKTKYRLTKGDQQLDQTFCVSPDPLKNHVPHHVSEFLSDIGYFTYKARITSKDLLCQHVRSKWVPEEYPSNIQRLFQWTPDECIPEFYDDPIIFKSIHEDLANLDYPDWCRDVKSFIDWHRSVLESDQVSMNLHHWIDLVFGYKLSGDAAIDAKNVQFHLKGNQQELRNYGVVQLFDTPHPRKLPIGDKDSPTQVSPSKRFENCLNPLYEMEKLQKFSYFGDKSKMNDIINVNELWKSLVNDQKMLKSQPILERCMKSLAILLIELCIPQSLHHLPHQASLSQRWILAEQSFRFKFSSIPRCLRSVVDIMMTKSGDHSPMEVDLVSPGFLLQPVAQLVPFPFYTPIWHECFCKMKDFDVNFENLKNSNDFSPTNLETLRNLKENKVRTLAKTIPLLLPQMSTDAIALVARVVKDLIEDQWTSVVAAWSLFNPMAEALGPCDTQKFFMGPLTSLFDSDLPCTRKHLKLYHRTFLLQVFVRIGTKEFLDNFILPLIEAVAGERDKLCMDEDAHSRHMVGHKVQKDPVIFRKQSRLRKEMNSCSDFRTSHSNSVLQELSRSSLRLDPVVKPGESDQVQFDLDISDDGIQFANKPAAPADDVVSTISSESLSSQPIQIEFEDEDVVEPVEPPVVIESNIPLVSEVAKESLMWMAHRLGPLLTSKYLTRNLLRMLALCYYDEKLSSNGTHESDGPFPCSVVGDTCALRVLGCLEHVASIYGEQFIVRHYFTHCSDMVQLASKRLNPNVEACLIACAVVVRHMFPFLTDAHLMDNLKDHYFVDNIMYPMVRLVSSLRLTFSSSRSREVLVWKLIDCLYCLGIRAGGENVKNYLFVVLQRLMCTYDVLYELQDGTVQRRTSPDGDDSVIIQLREIFGPQLASLAFVHFGQLVGRQYIQLSLPNSELVLKVCELHQTELVNRGLSTNLSVNSASIGAKALSGNRLAGLDPIASSPQINRKSSDAYCKRLKNSSRQVKGNWLAYWEHELGRSDRDTSFCLKQMKLTTFAGHTSQIRRICIMENENSFISASHDKTIKLWSLRSFGDGTCRSACQHTYRSHNKPLWDLTFVDSLRLLASTDGKIHIWDPFFGTVLREFDFGDTEQNLITITKSLAPPSKLVLAAGTSPSIKFLDVRQAKWIHEYKLGCHAFGPVRGVCLDPHGHWVAIGHGIGQLSVLDLRTGHFLVSKKIVDADISLMETTHKGSIVVSFPEQPLLVLKMPQCTFINKLPGPNENPVCMTSFYNELFVCTQNNRLRSFSSINSDASYSDSKLRSDVFSGNMSAMAFLPLNKLLLLGSTNGSIELLC